MADLFRNICRISDLSSKPESDTNKTLSIEFLPDGFVFSVMDADSYTYQALEAYKVSGNGGPESYCRLLPQFADNHSLLRHTYAKVIASVYSPDLLLVPDHLVEPDRIYQLYERYARLPDKHLLKSEPMHVMDAYGLYPVPESLPETCEKLFPGCSLKSYGLAMIRHVLTSQKLEKWKADVVIHIKSKHAEIILLNGNTLLFYRSFPVSCFDDVLYYLFYVLEQHRMQPEKLNVVAIGELPMDSPDYGTLSSFFKKVTLPDKNDVFGYSPSFEEIPLHYYFNLLNLNTCE